MERFRVEGGARLAGEVSVTGAKNSVLKVMAAALLAEGATTLHNVPDIGDVPIMADVLGGLGATVSGAAPSITIDVPDRLGDEAAYEHVRRIRGSVCVLGPLLGRLGSARVALPGGDAIGSRALDLHIGGLTKLGAEFDNEHGYIVGRAAQLTGASIWLDFPSVGATENILMAAVLAKGTTVIDNAAREPEIVDLCEMLQQMGAQIDGAGSSTLVVDGVDSLRPTTHVVVADRIVAGTYAYAAVMTRGEVRIRGGRAEHLGMPLEKLEQAGAFIDVYEDGFGVRMDGRPRAVDVVTLPYPGFPTDLQPMAIALAAVADGTSFVTENIFEGRFMFVDELKRLAVDARTDGHHAVIRGRERLSGAPVRATDIRAGVGLVLAGLLAEGTTVVSDAYHVDRGYQGFVEQMRALGADISREPDDQPAR
ncbi:MAG: UDP-N-acetylglucosamine 1-carboxyvinyltransferase [Frankiaceae bacterium]|jgi:UDP-N-acetylglucosamine 1-carboxyvinyltransferase|nr:UDP-N-acetylglucosamine 1-carboxyvinyltransferase [Frankiaceae bacterium]MDQ1726153.1 UDP-N-acetylglucosamine 1-carboxyvinyltransferase [Frankiaceae bacterium]